MNIFDVISLQVLLISCSPQIPERIGARLENHFFPNCKQQKFQVGAIPWLKNSKIPKIQSIGELGALLWKNFFEEVSQRRKKWKGGHFGGKKFREKSHNAEKNLNVNGDPLGSPGNVCYAEKRKNHFGSVPWANRCNL